MTTPISVLLTLASDENLLGDAFARSLSAVKVKNIKPSDKSVKLADGGGLVLYVPPTGAKVWRYRFRLAGKEQTLTIGGFPEVALEQARIAHRAARWLVERGESPLAFISAAVLKKQAESARSALETFEVTAKKWMLETAVGLAATTVKHRSAMVNTHLLPTLGTRVLAEITRKELSVLLKRLDAVTPETAKHCRIYISQIFDWAIDEELVAGNPTPPTRILVHHASRRIEPRKALKLSRLGDFLKTISSAPKTDAVTRAALRLVVASWCRTSEVVGAMWSEFDLENAIWTIPPERMKGNQRHTVYLAAQVVVLLKAMRDLSSGVYLFPNRRDPQRPMSRMSLTSWRKRWGFADEMEIHGLRAVASTWANESGKYRSEVIEVALAHREQDRVRAAYNRAEFIRELRAMWQDWADLCEKEELVGVCNPAVKIPRVKK